MVKNTSSEISSKNAGKPKLKKNLTLPLVTLYGIGVTIGAGIYVLIGAAAAKAGVYAPIAFLLAAFVATFTGLSYAELSTRMPVSAGEAAYVKRGFQSEKLALIVGLLVTASGIISAATVSIGAASYLQHFLSLPPNLLIALIIILLGMVAIWGILESVILASIFTLLEIGGLCLVIYYGVQMTPDITSSFINVIPPFEKTVWAGILSASLLAFFAFVGFEDIANIAEEVKSPRKTMPWAIILTLLVSSIIYFGVVMVVVLAVPMDVLTKSSAPLALIFKNAGNNSANIFNGIAIIATFNGVLIQIIMASRILYGLGKQENLPQLFADINPYTRTPLKATLFVVVLVLALALFFPIGQLAEATAIVVLVIFSLVNLALLKIKYTSTLEDTSIFEIPAAIPIIGFIMSVMMLLTALL